MKALLILSFILIQFCSFGQSITNQYGLLTGAMTITGGNTLVDLKGSANGTLGGASLPQIDANGFLTFTGGNGATGGNWNRVDFTLTSFQYAWNQSHSWVCIFKSSKSDAVAHFLVDIYDDAVTTSEYLAIFSDETLNTFLRSATGQAKQNISAVNVCDGKWHIAIFSYATNSLSVYIDGKFYALTLDQAITSGAFYGANSKICMGAGWAQATSNYKYDLSGSVRFFSSINTSLSIANISDINNESRFLY